MRGSLFITRWWRDSGKFGCKHGRPAVSPPADPYPVIAPLSPRGKHQFCKKNKKTLTVKPVNFCLRQQTKIHYRSTTQSSDRILPSSVKNQSEADCVSLVNCVSVRRVPSEFCSPRFPASSHFQGSALLHFQPHSSIIANPHITAFERRLSATALSAQYSQPTCASLARLSTTTRKSAQVFALLRSLTN